MLAAILAALAFTFLSPAIAAPRSAMARYYAHKYPAWQIRLVAAGIDQVFTGVGPEARHEAILDTLAFFHVVYHPTRSHRIENNLAVTRRYRDEIALACERFGVPKAMALAILTWENSGSTAATSFAACVGMGQLSEGAMRQAHRLSARFARVHLAAEGFCFLLANVLEGIWGGNALTHAIRDRGEWLQARALELDLEAVHAGLARSSGIADERAIPRANIEDSVVYMRYLLEMFGGRADLAISAYHNGVANTDDLLRDYLRRKDPAASHFTFRDRAPLLAAIRRHRISYVTLWQDRRCHQMLNGLRTMDGDITTPANAREAMGDESDIYVWKTLAALAGLRASESQLAELCDRYAGPQADVEIARFKPGDDLVRAYGVRLTREMAGYLDSVDRRLALMYGKKPRPSLPVRAAHFSESHQNGVAVDLRLDDGRLARLIHEDWLFDRIYTSRLPDGRVHVCLNPRYGDEYLSRWEASQRSASAADAR
jgi:hypothetical protein